ncbi:MAG: class I SAM-dependent methyltransferase [Candidatus Gottesmanbacteria bacterium]
MNQENKNEDLEKPNPQKSVWYNKDYFDPSPGKVISGYDTGYSEKSMKLKFNLITHLIRRYCLAKLIRGGKEVKVLELGGAKGLLTKRLNKLPHTQAVNIDWSEYATQNCDPEAPTVRGDLQALPFPLETFDTLVSCDVFEHLLPENVDIVLEEAHRVLKPGGNAFFMVSIKTSYLPIEEKSHLTLEDINWWKRKFKQAGFITHKNLLTRVAATLTSIQPKLKSPMYPWPEGVFILSKPQ